MDSLDPNGDGSLNLKELQVAMKKAHLDVAPHYVARMFDDIYSLNGAVREILDDSINTNLDDCDKAITASELEQYVLKLHPSTHDERMGMITRAFFESPACWAIAGNLVSKCITSFGLEYMGPLQAWDCMAWNPEYIAPQATFRSLNVLGCVGFNSLFYMGCKSQFDAFESAEKAVVSTFKQAEKERDSENATIDLENPSGRRTSAMIGMLEDGDEMNIDSVGDLLRKAKVHISESSLQHLFKKIDTSGDSLISVREIRTYAETWEPASLDKRLMAIAGGFFSLAGFCLFLMLIGVRWVLGFCVDAITVLRFRIWVYLATTFCGETTWMQTPRTRFHL
jgi:Ca2+-binding EF-hand superfamily protein